MAVDLLRRADLVDGALVHHHDAVGHGERLFLVVRHHDGGDAQGALQRLDLVPQAQPDAGVERREGLVEQQQPRRRRQRAGQRHPLLLAARELGGIFRPGIGQADQRQQLVDPFRDRAARLAAAHQPVADIVG